jgi:hypothetical protein
MESQLAHPPHGMFVGRVERRKTERHRAEVSVVLISSLNERAAVHLADVSTHGCNIRGEAGWLRAGAFVSIALGDEPPLRAIVRWTRDGEAGMEFILPVPPSRREWRDLIDSPLGS